MATPETELALEALAEVPPYRPQLTPSEVGRIERWLVRGLTASETARRARRSRPTVDRIKRRMWREGTLPKGKLHGNSREARLAREDAP